MKNNYRGEKCYCFLFLQIFSLYGLTEGSWISTVAIVTCCICRKSSLTEIHSLEKGSILTVFSYNCGYLLDTH